ncbi:MAG: YkgJ family cysteine cluster protein [Betaproteobacteria bacterium]|nr:YkgJ family cysteine cluster protein [Betaproteobacteria bacterium]NBP45773.1 YkgJ family cysteine cluster protein [Betaproteobacteria bacterium]
MSHALDCTRCGACCASFRVDFSVYESEAQGGQVPDGLCAPLTDQLCRMNGTDHATPRCAALSGRIGHNARCGIYEWRPSPCREFEAGSDACLRVRQRHGLSPDPGQASA